jgi:hypothetical protein
LKTAPSWVLNSIKLTTQSSPSVIWARRCASSSESFTPLSRVCVCGGGGVGLIRWERRVGIYQERANEQAAPRLPHCVHDATPHTYSSITYSNATGPLRRFPPPPPTVGAGKWRCKQAMSSAKGQRRLTGMKESRICVLCLCGVGGVRRDWLVESWFVVP